MTTDFIERHKAGVLLFTFSSFSLLCMAMRIDAYIVGIKTAAWYLISPEVVYSGLFFNKLDSLKGGIFRLIKVDGENHILRQQNAQLAKRDAERDALVEENNRFRHLLELKEKTFPDAVAAEIVARDPRNWFHSVIIDKGEAHGVRPSAAVVAIYKDRPVLVGRVSELSENESKILLITDGVSAVSVSVVEKGDIGLLEGRNKPWVAMNYLSRQSEVASGDRVVTVGLGGIFPPGIDVGSVSQTELTTDGYFKSARVDLPAAIDSLREVLILQRRDITQP